MFNFLKKRPPTFSDDINRVIKQINKCNDFYNEIYTGRHSRLYIKVPVRYDIHLYSIGVTQLLKDIDTGKPRTHLDISIEHIKLKYFLTNNRLIDKDIKGTLIRVLSNLIRLSEYYDEHRYTSNYSTIIRPYISIGKQLVDALK